MSSRRSPSESGGGRTPESDEGSVARAGGGAGGGEPPGSSAFHLLDRRVQRWIWKEGWDALRDAQEAAIGPILDGEQDVVIAAATAAGKTEAAFLPIVSSIVGPGVEEGGGGIRALYVAPLKALINDQFRRLEDLCRDLHVPVARWHGDVPNDRKRALVKRPEGILLITPESLEAILVVHGTKVARLFGPVGHVVVDELHAFLGSERGRQLQSLLARVETAVERRVPRIGLSATIGDLGLAAEFLRPGEGRSALLIESAAGGQEVKLQVRGYRRRPPALGATAAEERGVDDDLEIARHLFETLRGSDNLVFANSRVSVESYADMLRRLSETARVPNEFLPHHGSLAKGLREDVEKRLKRRDDPHLTVVCTTTLEMGLDIGSVASVAQVGSPPSVASLRQRLGRSGRRGEAAVLRMYVQEEELTPNSSPLDALRPTLFQTVAMVELLLEGWCEPPEHGAPHFSTLLQQVLALVAQRGAVTARRAHAELCGRGPFRSVDAPAFTTLLRRMGEEDLLVQLHDGTLTLGLAGERIVNHYSFFVVFPTPEEFRIAHGDKPLGQMAVSRLWQAGDFLIFAGRRWLVENVELERKIIWVSPQRGGRLPLFDCPGGGFGIHDRVRRKMLELYRGADAPRYLDVRGRELLSEGRQGFVRHGLDARSLTEDGEDALVFPWLGDRALDTLGYLLKDQGVRCTRHGPALRVTERTPEAVGVLLRELRALPRPEPLELARRLPWNPLEKYEHLIGDELLARERAARELDLPGAAAALEAVGR